MLLYVILPVTLQGTLLKGITPFYPQRAPVGQTSGLGVGGEGGRCQINYLNNHMSVLVPLVNLVN